MGVSGAGKAERRAYKKKRGESVEKKRNESEM